MTMVPQPYREADLIMQGSNSLGQGIGQWAQDRALDRPGDSKLDAYIDRLLAGADPEQLKREMYNDPDAEVRAIFGSLQTPPERVRPLVSGSSSD